RLVLTGAGTEVTERRAHQGTEPERVAAAHCRPVVAEVVAHFVRALRRIARHARTDPAGRTRPLPLHLRRRVSELRSDVLEKLGQSLSGSIHRCARHRLLAFTRT